MPTPTLDNQGQTYRCGPFSVRQWFEGYGMHITDKPAWAAAIATADAQQGFSFEQERQFVVDLAAECGQAVLWLGDGYLRDFPTFEQAVRDRWCVVVGVKLSDLHPGMNYYHYEDVYGTDFETADPFHMIDGDNGHPALADLETAIRDNWDASIIGLAWKLT